MNYTIKKLAEELVKSGYYVIVGDKEKAIYHNKKGYHKDPRFPELKNINNAWDDFMDLPAKFKFKFATEKEIKELHYHMLPDYVKRVKEGEDIENLWHTILPKSIKRYATPDLINQIKEGKEKYIQIGRRDHKIKYKNGEFKVIQVDRLNNLRRAGFKEV